MQLNLRVIATLFVTEMRMVLRDRRILITSIVLPLFVTPLMFLGSNWSLQRREKQLQNLVYRYTITGAEQDEVRSLISLAKDLARSNATAAVERSARRPAGRRSAPPAGALRFDEVGCTNALAALAKGEIQLVLEGLAGGRGDPAQKGAAVTTNATPAIKDDDREPSLAEVPLIRLIYRADRDESAAALSQMDNGLREARRARREELLKAHGLSITMRQLAMTREVDLASDRKSVV